MKKLLWLPWLLSFALLVSCGTSNMDYGHPLPESAGKVEWVLPGNKKYGVIKKTDNKYFPYYNGMDLLRYNDVVYNLPEYGLANVQLQISGAANSSTGLYLYEHKMSRHRAVAYIRMITMLGENHTDRRP